VQELTGWRGWSGRVFATALTAGVPLVFVTWTATDASGRVIPAWQVFWELFGASNQLLAALTLVGVTVWLWRTGRSRVLLAVTGAPAAFMYVMSTWALLRFIKAGFFGPAWEFAGPPASPVPWVALLLVALAGLVLAEGLRVVIRTRTRSRLATS
jgi:carbon starvation protein